MTGNASVVGFLAPERQKRLDDLGYDVVSLFSASDLDDLRAAYDRLASEVTSGFHATMYSSSGDYRRTVYELLAPLVMDRLRGVLSGYRLRVANWVVKEAGQADSTVSYHQDWSFVDEESCRSINLWFPLIDVDEQNGCLEVVAGSHLVSTEHRSHADKCRFDDLTATLRATYTTPVPMTAGQGIFYDGALLHASAHNRSPTRRIAVGTVLVPEAAQVVHTYRISPTAVEVFAVDDAFFWRHQPGTRPNAPMVDTVDSSTSQHGQEALRVLVARPGG
ncbi:MAG: phytanoyl-CoA dioxygenase family protein [Vicinamibacterales bacterium]